MRVFNSLYTLLDECENKRLAELVFRAFVHVKRFVIARDERTLEAPGGGKVLRLGRKGPRSGLASLAGCEYSNGFALFTPPYSTLIHTCQQYSVVIVFE